MARAGEIYVPSTSAELREQFLSDVRLGAIDAGLIEEPPTGPGSDWYLLGTATANIVFVGVANTAIADEDKSVLTATGDALDEHRKALGLPVVEATGSSGKIRIKVSGATVVQNGQQLTLANGKRIRVVGTYTNPANNAELDVQAVDTGTATNAKAGTKVTFAPSAPVNVTAEAEVAASSPLTGGTDAENDARKRDRILNTLRNKPGGGNWADIRQAVLDNLGGVVDCYVYPALGGPSSQKVVPVKAFEPEINDFSRTPSDALVAQVRALIHSRFSTGIETVVQGAADQNLDAALEIEIPDSAQAGGNGQGWIDTVPWPPHATPAGPVTIDAVDADADQITIDAATSTAPVDGQTHVAWWSSVDRRFYTALVVTHSGSAGAWVLNLDHPLVGKDGGIPLVGDYVCPAAENIEAYGDAWVKMIESLGPGENTAAVGRVPRALRHPFQAEEDPAAISSVQLNEWARKFPEITDVDTSTLSASAPTVPGAVATAPNVFVPRHFGVYQV
jgi:uncharacterized phage protein gp47/JayE